MKKFSEIEYVRPDMEAEQEKVRAAPHMILPL